MVTKAIKRTKWKYRKKRPPFRKPMIMEVFEDLPMAREITSRGLEFANLSKGRYEIRIVANPDPEKRTRYSRWVLAEANGRQIGLAKNFVNKLREQGLVRIFILGE